MMLVSFQDSRIFPLYQDPRLQEQVFHGQTLSVYYPASPRVSHHLAIAFHRHTVRSIADVTQVENRELFATINKIAEVYKTVEIQGFVVAFKGDVVEIIPHLPRFHDIKHMLDKVDCNRYVLFPDALLSTLDYVIPKETSSFWKERLSQSSLPLKRRDWELPLPFTRYESHHAESEALLQKRHSPELHENQSPRNIATDPFTESPILSAEVRSCAFCKDEVLQSQVVYEYGNALILYNIRSGEKPGCNFLILPKRHTEKIYGLTPEEIEDIRILRSALMEVLQETHPENRIVLYIQDSPSTGQTVPHTHEQVVSLHPQTMPHFWTEQSLRPFLRISDEEMQKVCEEFRKKLDEKLSERATKHSA